MCPNLSHTSIIVYQTDQYETEDSPKNILIGYIVTLIHSDKLLWENVMNYATLYSLKFLFEGGGVLLVFDIYICQNWSHTSIIGIKLTSIWQRIPQNRLMGYIVHFYSFRQTFMRKCNELCNTPLAEIFAWGWVISLSNSFTCNMNTH